MVNVEHFLLTKTIVTDFFIIFFGQLATDTLMKRFLWSDDQKLPGLPSSQYF